MKARKLLFIKGYFEKLPVKTFTFIDFKKHTGLETQQRVKTKMMMIKQLTPTV